MATEFARSVRRGYARDVEHESDDGKDDEDDDQDFHVAVIPGIAGAYTRERLAMYMTRAMMARTTRIRIRIPM